MNIKTLPWITSVNNFRFFTNIWETLLSTNMNYISLEGHFLALLFVFVA